MASAGGEAPDAARAECDALRRERDKLRDQVRRARPLSAPKFRLRAAAVAAPLLSPPASTCTHHQQQTTHTVQLYRTLRSVAIFTGYLHQHRPEAYSKQLTLANTQHTPHRLQLYRALRSVVIFRGYLHQHIPEDDALGLLKADWELRFVTLGSGGLLKIYDSDRDEAREPGAMLHVAVSMRESLPAQLQPCIWQGAVAAQLL